MVSKTYYTIITDEKKHALADSPEKVIGLICQAIREHSQGLQVYACYPKAGDGPFRWRWSDEPVIDMVRDKDTYSLKVHQSFNAFI